MKVADLIKQLQSVPGELEVWVSDSYEGTDYHGEFKIQVLAGVSHDKYCEVEIGGLMVN